jgi:hypothetical protein
VSTALVACAWACLWVGAACGASTAVCGPAFECPSGSVCGPGLTCELARPLAELRELRFEASDWSVTREDRPTELVDPTDAIEVGGDAAARAHLRFSVPVETVERALLRLAPHQSSVAPERPAMLLVRPTLPFRGETLTRARALRDVGPAASRTIGRNAPRSVLVDVTALVRRTQARRERSLYLELRSASDATLRFGSPRNVARERRPRLIAHVR